MPDVKWIKITTDIFDDEKILMIESMPAADSILVIWFKLLTFAGKQNNGGVFIMSNKIAYTDEMLASIFRRDVNTVRLALKTFEAFGMVELLGDVIALPNWNKHQTLDAYEKKKARDRLYQAERRASQKALIAASSDKSSDSKTIPSSDVAVSDKEREEDKRNNISAQISSALDEKFAAFWKAYPKKKGKTDALKAFKKLKPTQGMIDQMLAAIEKQKKSDQWQREHGQYIPYPAKWLKHGQWEDEVEESATHIPRVSAPLMLSEDDYL